MVSLVSALKNAMERAVVVSVIITECDCRVAFHTGNFTPRIGSANEFDLCQKK